MRRFFGPAILLGAIITLLAGCASGPNSVLSNNAASSSGGGSGSSTHFIQFSLTLSPQGTFDNINGLYAIVFNSLNQPIDVTQNDKFTDFMLWDGTNLTWYHRQATAESTSLDFVPVSNVNQALSFTADRRTMNINFSVEDTTNPLNQFIVSSQFTCDAVTTDRSGILGRVIDTMGPGPDLSQDTLYTISVDKLLGPLNPLPPNYPTDPLNDFIVQPDLDPSFPYANFDIQQFQITTH